MVKSCVTVLLSGWGSVAFRKRNISNQNVVELNHISKFVTVWDLAGLFIIE